MMNYIPVPDPNLTLLGKKCHFLNFDARFQLFSFNLGIIMWLNNFFLQLLLKIFDNSINPKTALFGGGTVSSCVVAQP